MSDCWYRIDSWPKKHQVVECCRYRLRGDGCKTMAEPFTTRQEAERYILWLEGWSLEEIDAGEARELS